MRKSTHRDDAAITKIARRLIGEAEIGDTILAASIKDAMENERAINARWIDIDAAMEKIETEEGIISNAVGTYDYKRCEPMAVKVDKVEGTQGIGGQPFRTFHLSGGVTAILSLHLSGQGQKHVESILVSDMIKHEGRTMNLCERRAKTLLNIVKGVMDKRIYGELGGNRACSV